MGVAIQVLMNAHLVMVLGSTQFVELGIIHSRAKTIKNNATHRNMGGFFFAQIF